LLFPLFALAHLLDDGLGDGGKSYFPALITKPLNGSICALTFPVNTSTIVISK